MKLSNKEITLILDGLSKLKSPWIENSPKYIEIETLQNRFLKKKE